MASTDLSWSFRSRDGGFASCVQVLVVWLTVPGMPVCVRLLWWFALTQSELFGASRHGFSQSLFCFLKEITFGLINLVAKYCLVGVEFAFYCGFFFYFHWIALMFFFVLCRSYVFRFVRNCQADFHSGCTSFHSHQQWEVPSHCSIFVHLSQRLVLSVLWTLSTLIGV